MSETDRLPAGQGILTCGNMNFLVPLPPKEAKP